MLAKTNEWKTISFEEVSLMLAYVKFDGVLSEIKSTTITEQIIRLNSNTQSVKDLSVGDIKKVHKSDLKQLPEIQTKYSYGRLEKQK